MPWKAQVTSRFCSSQGLVQSFATRAKVASCTEKCSVSCSKKKVTAIFIPKRFKAQKLLPCGRFLRRHSLVSAKIHGLMAFPSHRHGLSLMSIMLKRRPGSLNREDIKCSQEQERTVGPNGHSLHLARRIVGWCHCHSIDAGKEIVEC